MMDDKIIADAVFERIKAHYHLSSDAAMARHLGIAPQDITRFRKTGNVPYKQILSVCPPADWSYVFKGEAPKSNLSPSEMIHRLIDMGYRVEKRD